jgi:molybdopterin-guanine dinucleotide biosynthesis protein A
VLVCAVDLPLVGETLVRSITSAAAGSARAVVASAGGRLQPALGCYGPAALNPLASALASDDLMLSDAIRAIDPIVLEVANPEELLNVNTPEDLLEAAALLDGSRSQPNVKS